MSFNIATMHAVTTLRSIDVSRTKVLIWVDFNASLISTGRGASLELFEGKTLLGFENHNKTRKA